MAGTSSFRIRRRSVNAFEPATAHQGERKDSQFFGPSSAEPFFSPQARRTPEPDAEKAQAKPEPGPAEEKKEEEKVQAKGDAPPEEERKEEKLHAKSEAPPAEEKKEEAQVQAKGDGQNPAAGATAEYVRSIDGRGRPLPSRDRAWFEQRMGYDFSEVRVHTGSDAAHSAKASHAKAYAYGNHIVFGSGQYEPDTHTGRHLLAHELTHVVQQRSPRASGVVAGAVGRKIQRGFWSDVWDTVTGTARDVAEGVGDVASSARDVVRAAGSWVWELASWAPGRVWALLTHAGSGIVNVCNWLWSGLVQGAGHVWDGVTAALSFAQQGVEGLFAWIWRGLGHGRAWALRLLHGDYGAFWDGLAETWSWLGEGVRGLLDWQFVALQGLAIWTSQGVRGFARWLWDGVLMQAAWVGRFLAKVLDLLGAGEHWTLLTSYLKFWSTRTLTPVEEAEARKVFGGGLAYGRIRIDEGSLIAAVGAWFQNAQGMGVTIAQNINFNRPIQAAPGNGDMAWLIHELAHVGQYTSVGLQYMGEALHAQATAGYGYGGGAALAGKDLKDFNREQQGDILRHYYTEVEYGASVYAADYTRMRDQAVQGKF